MTPSLGDPTPWPGPGRTGPDSGFQIPDSTNKQIKILLKCRKNNRRPDDDSVDVHFEGINDDKQALLTEVAILDEEETEA